MANHPNRSKKPNAPGRSPRPEEVKQLRDRMGITQRQLGDLVYATEATARAWESGERRMPGLPWEVLNLLYLFPEQKRLRDRWLASQD